MKPHFQCLLHCAGAEYSRPNILLAASGPLIHSFNVDSVKPVYTWPTRDLEGNRITTATSTGCTKDSTDEDAERPAKRRRTSLSREVSSSTSAEILVENLDETEPLNELQVSSSDVTKMICTSSGEYAIVVTGEDKTVRVFQVQEDGSLIQISER